MKKKIDLIFHVGFIKTASTFLQTNFEKIDDTLFVGKFNSKSSKEFLGKLNSIHGELYRIYRMEVIKGFKNPSRSSSSLVVNYTNELVKLISEKNVKRLVISDEEIADYGNHIGEWNVLLQIIIGNLVEKELTKKNYIVNKNLSYTIRNQIDILQSLYGYNKTLGIKSFDKFIEIFGSDHNDSFIGGFKYYSNISLVENVAKNNWKINVVPYEYLSIENKPEKYVNEVLGIKDEKDYLKVAQISKINSNKLKINSISYQLNRDKSLFTRIGYSLIQENIYSYKHASKRKFYIRIFLYALLYFLGKLFYFLGKIFENLHYYFFKTKPVLLTNKSKEKIKEIYNQDNLKLLIK